MLQQYYCITASNFGVEDKCIGTKVLYKSLQMLSSLLRMRASIWGIPQIVALTYSTAEISLFGNSPYSNIFFKSSAPIPHIVVFQKFPILCLFKNIAHTSPYYGIQKFPKFKQFFKTSIPVPHIVVFQNFPILWLFKTSSLTSPYYGILKFPKFKQFFKRSITLPHILVF